MKHLNDFTFGDLEYCTYYLGDDDYGFDIRNPDGEVLESFSGYIDEHATIEAAESLLLKEHT